MPKEKSPGKPTTRRYADTEKDQAVRLVRKLREELGTDHATVQLVAHQLGYGDVVMMQVLMVLWVANRKVYGAHKLWKAAQRAGHDVGRDPVARLMRQMAIEG